MSEGKTKLCENRHSHLAQLYQITSACQALLFGQQSLLSQEAQCCLLRLELPSMALSDPQLPQPSCYLSLDFHLLAAMTDLLKCIWKLRWKERKKMK